ncbi:hypothetical protein QN360_04290 [Glaciimonas sp. CA11.2]|uniref:hypothetical protein n=1 Tax=Glaciimonas sp. CA11.2 TaxID=3048601 RepID=UPI002AB389E9|nr:hypothetical protein [Glaciimonas sp. CA11.2]MDY7546664.1 hypothetical protein [Glaciimonas sp. CA11.2]MEB0162128.1 hypothetical protein [Glaciimonas sp. CA11.2]
MLTTTYAFLSLSMEQKRLHFLLSAAQQLLQINADRQRLDVATRKSVIKQFSRLAAGCRKRKIETYVIPAIQSVTHQADRRLSEMESSKVIGRKILDEVKAWAKVSSERSSNDTTELYSSIERSCNNLLKRLAMEEEELLPLAQRIISNDEWFAMGAHFLATDIPKKMRRQTDHIKPTKVESRSVILSDPLISLVVSGYAYSQ